MLMPTPELAPSRTRSPMAIFSLPPPERVPMIEAPPPTSRAVAGHDAGRDAAFDHGGAQRAGVEVHEAFVHDGGAFGEVGTEADAVGVGDPDAGGHHVVHHARELVDAEDGDGAAPAQLGAGQFEAFHGGGAEVGPHDVGELAEDAVQVDGVGPDQAVREQVQAKVGVGGVRRGLVEVDLDEDHLLLGAAVRVRAAGGDVSQGLVGVLHGAQVFGRDAQGRRREPDIQHGGFRRCGWRWWPRRSRRRSGRRSGVLGLGHGGSSGLSHGPSLSRRRARPKRPCPAGRIRAVRPATWTSCRRAGQGRGYSGW